MDYRYVVVGVNIIALSIGFIIFALLEKLELVLGISLSVLLLGIIVLSIGLTYIEPLDKLYRTAYRIISLMFIKILEDSNLIYNNVIRTCLSDKNLLLISHQGINCRDIYPGIGVLDGKPFIAIPLSLLSPAFLEYGTISHLDEYELESIIRSNILHAYNMGRDVKVNIEKDDLFITFYGLRREVIDIVKKPINPIKVLIVAIVSAYIGREIVLKGNEIIEDNYTVHLKVVERD